VVHSSVLSSVRWPMAMGVVMCTVFGGSKYGRRWTNTGVVVLYTEIFWTILSCGGESATVYSGVVSGEILGVCLFRARLSWGEIGVMVDSLSCCHARIRGGGVSTVDKSTGVLLCATKIARLDVTKFEFRRRQGHC